MTDNQDLLSDYVLDVSNRNADLLKVVHINAQSLNNDEHFTEFNQIFSNSGIDVIAVSETFFKDSSHIQVPNYNVFNVNRLTRGGGGVAVYVAEHLAAKTLYQTQNDGYKPEYIFLEITCQASKVLFICMYRPPDIFHMDLFMTDVYKYLPNYKYVILCGDLNARFGSGSDETVVVEESLNMCNLTVVPFNDTYHTHYSSSNLDVVASNVDDLLVEYGQTPAPAFSCHDLIYAVFDLRIPPKSKQEITFRDFHNINVEKLYEDIDGVTWDHILQTNNVEDKVNGFNLILNDLMDKHAPMKTVKVKHNSTPWMTRDILKLISKRNRARKKHIKYKTEASYKYFRELRNRTKQAIRNAKIKYYHKVLNNSSSKTVWKGIRSLGIKTKSTKENITDLPVNVNELNDHYASVSSIDDAEAVEAEINMYAKKPCPDYDKFYFAYVCPLEIKNAISSIKSNAVGVDGISVTFLKLILDKVIIIIEHIFNFCLQSGLFPEVWKMSNIKPVPKCKNPTQCKDYRPVSILCVLAKALEKVVHKQITEYMQRFSIGNPLQSGFKKGHNTVTALIKVADDLRKAIDQKKMSSLILLDFSKAFDKVHHKLLLVKLKNLGFSDSAVKWFQEYLSSRCHRVFLNDCIFSEWAFPDTGVPQGSVLGPLLFALYINDISNVLKFCLFHLYADDFQIYIHFDIRNFQMAYEQANEDLVGIVTYSNAHNLPLNIGKTQPIIIGSTPFVAMLEKREIPEICINGISIPYQTSVVNLGVTFDCTMSWNQHCISVINRVFAMLAQVRRNFEFLPPNIRTRVVQTLIFPLFDYANALFTDMPVTILHKMQRAQNACIRFISGIRKCDHVTPIYCDLNILMIEDRIKLSTAVLVWKIRKFKIPQYLYINYVHMSSVNARVNRFTASTMLIPSHRTEKYAKSFLVTTSKLWNEVNIENFMRYTTVKPLQINLKETLCLKYKQQKLVCKL